MGLLLFYLFLALSVSFLCSILESVLLSTPNTYLKAQQNEGVFYAATMLELKKKIDQPLSAILSLNTIAHTIGAAGVGAQATKIFGEAYFGLVSAVLTFLILVITEIIPKTLGARYWKKLTAFTTATIKYLIILTYPLVVLSNRVSDFFSEEQPEGTVSRAEMQALAEIGNEEGIFDERETRIFQNLLLLRDVRVEQIMTPRVVVRLADESLPVKEFMKNSNLLRYSRIPIYSESPENIRGYIMRQQVFERLASGDEQFTLADVNREAMVYGPSRLVLDVWDGMLKKKEHIAFIIDEYGGLEGIVTMEDIIETLLGFEIIDETDEVPDMQQLARQRWQARKRQYPSLYTDEES